MMNFFKLVLRKIWRFFFFLNGAVTFLILFPFFYILLLREPWFKYVFKLKRFWARLIIYNVGIRQKVIFKGKPHIPHPAVICPNHTSFLDIVMTYIVCRNYFHFMGKAELKKVPLFNKFFDNMNILVDRRSIIASHKAFTRAGIDLQKGISISIFPEATIPACAPELGRLKNGAFKLAIDKQVPVVPIVFVDNWKILPDGELKKTGGRPGKSRVVVLEPIPTKGLAEGDVETLKQKYHQAMVNTLKEYNCGEEARIMKTALTV